LRKHSEIPFDRWWLGEKHLHWLFLDVFILIANVLVGAVAYYYQHRNPVGWFFIACLVSPVLAGIALLIMGPSDSAEGA
jgi:hypothetical protein